MKTAKIAVQAARGFSLVELMVALVLGLILMSGAAGIYIASKRSYSELEQVAGISDNGRFVLQLISESLRHAGFFGEVTAGRMTRDANLSAIAGDCTGAGAVYQYTSYLFATTSNGGGNALGCVTDAVPNTDVLVIKHAIPRPLSDGDRDNPDLADPLVGDGVIDTPSALQATSTYVMTNGIGGVLFDGADTAPTITEGGEIPGGVAWEYAYELYYLRDGDIPWLARKSLAWDAGAGAMSIVTENMVQGVENMRFRFGYDTSGDGEVDTYGNATEVAGNWDRIESVEVSVLLRNALEDPQYQNAKTYNLGDLALTPADSFRRIMVSTNVSLRNPKLVVRGDA